VTGGLSTDSQIWVIKTGGDGEKQWERKLGNLTPSSDPYWDWGWSVVETDEGDFVVAGNTWNGAERKHDVVLTKLNAQGSTLWQKFYGSLGNDFGYELTALENGGFAIIGETNFDNSDNPRDIYLIITDSKGDEIISQNFGGPNHDRGFSIQAISDTSFVFTGDTIADDSNDLDAYFAKINLVSVTNNTAPSAIDNSYVQPKTYTSTTGNAIIDNTDNDGDGSLDDVDSDPDSDLLYIDIANSDATSAFGGTITWADNGTFTYTPVDNFAGHDQFDYTIHDGCGGFDTATVFMEVQSQNQRSIEMDNLTANLGNGEIDGLTGLPALTGTFDIHNASDDGANLVQIISVDVNYDQKSNPNGKGKWTAVDSSHYKNYFWLDDGDGILNNGEELLEDLNPNKERFQIQVVFSDDVTIGYGSSFSGTNPVTNNPFDVPDPLRVNASAEIYGRDKLFGFTESFDFA
jgi:hypothetical protein